MSPTTHGQWRAGGRRHDADVFLVDLVADHATDGCTADGAGCTAAGEHGTGDATDGCAGGGVLFARRHVAAGTE
jgi:hypothetical protein